MAKGRQNPGGYVGTTGSYSTGGIFKIKEQQILQGASLWTPPVVTSGLQLHLDAATYSGSGTSWNDISGNGYTATLINSPTYTANANGGYFTVVASSQQTMSVVKPNPNITGNITSEIWVYFPSTVTNSPTLNHKGSHYTIQMVGQNSYYWADSSMYSYATYGLRTATGIGNVGWRQIVVTKDSSYTVRVYLNGVLTDTRTSFGTVGLAATATTLWINGYSDTDTTPSAGNMMDGRIAISRIYNRQLSDAEVLQNFNANRGRFGI